MEKRLRFLLPAAIAFLFVPLLMSAPLKGAELLKARHLTAGGSSSVLARTGIAKGFFKQEGLDLEVLHVATGQLTISAVQSGSADLGQSAYNNVVAAVSKGLPLVVVTIHNYGYMAKVLVSNKIQGAKSMADLKGKSIAVQVGTGVYTVWARYLGSLGLSRNDFQIKNMRTTVIPSAFDSGSVDAAVVWEPFASTVVKKGAGRVMLEEKDIADPIGVTYPFFVFTTKKEVQEKPEVVQRFLNAWVRSMRFVTTQREETIDIMTKAFQREGQSVDRESTREIIYSSMRYDRAKLNQKDIQDTMAMAQFLKEDGVIDRIPKSEEFINTSFAEKAEKTVK